jgi:hypothetical protein
MENNINPLAEIPDLQTGDEKLRGVIAASGRLHFNKEICHSRLLG